MLGDHDGGGHRGQVTQVGQEGDGDQADGIAEVGVEEVLEHDREAE